MDFVLFPFPHESFGAIVTHAQYGGAYATLVETDTGAGVEEQSRPSGSRRCAANAATDRLPADRPTSVKVSGLGARHRGPQLYAYLPPTSREIW